MSIHGSMFNPTDVENAADNPFELNVGRNEIVVSESGPDTITINGNELSVWKVVLRDPADDPESYRRQDVLFFLDGDERQKAQTNTSIKKMLKGLEVPVNKWEEISANPEKLIGYAGVVDLARSKKDRLYVKDWFGPAKGGAVGSNAPAKSNNVSAAAASMIGDL